MTHIVGSCVLAVCLVAVGAFSSRLGAWNAARAVARAEAAERDGLALHVIHVDGAPRASYTAPPLIPGDILRVGVSVHLGTGDAMRMVTPLGDRVRVHGPGAFTVVRREPRSLELRLRAGHLDFIAAADGVLSVDTGAGPRSLGSGGRIDL